VSAVRTVNATGNASVTLDVVDERPLRYDAAERPDRPGGDGDRDGAGVQQRRTRGRSRSLHGRPRRLDGRVVRRDRGPAWTTRTKFTFRVSSRRRVGACDPDGSPPRRTRRRERYRFDAVTEPTGTPNATRRARWVGVRCSSPRTDGFDDAYVHAGDDEQRRDVRWDPTRPSGDRTPPLVTQSLTTSRAGPAYRSVAARERHARVRRRRRRRGGAGLSTGRGTDGSPSDLLIVGRRESEGQPVTSTGARRFPVRRFGKTYLERTREDGRTPSPPSQAASVTGPEARARRPAVETPASTRASRSRDSDGRLRRL